MDVRGIAGGTKCSPVSIKSSFGPVRLYLPEDAAFTVNAHTSFGKITTQLPLTISGSPSSDTLTGRLGDGRPGRVTLELRDAYWAAHDDPRYTTPVSYARTYVPGASPSTG